MATTFTVHPAKAVQETWHQYYPACLDCGHDDKPHVARGLCKSCYTAMNALGDDYRGNMGPKLNNSMTHVEKRAATLVAIGNARDKGWRPVSEERAQVTVAAPWHEVYKACRDCGSTRFAHSSEGRCVDCVLREMGGGFPAAASAELAGIAPPIMVGSMRQKPTGAEVYPPATPIKPAAPPIPRIH